MEELIITNMDMNSDYKQVVSWDETFKDNESYKTIREYILEDFIYDNLAEVIKVNYEEYFIGDNERHYCLAIKDKDIVAGFIIASEFDLQTDSPTLFLQYIVLSPVYQAKGHGASILKRLIYNEDNLLEKNPASVFSYIERGNFPSQKIYIENGFGFEIKRSAEGKLTNYLLAEKHILTNEDTKE